MRTGGKASDYKIKVCRSKCRYYYRKEIKPGKGTAMDIKSVSADIGSAGALVNAGGEGVPARKSAEAGEKNTSGGDAALTAQQVKQVAEELQEQMRFMGISLNFTPYGENKERMAVIVTDEKTGKVIREIPPKEIQNLYVKMSELIGAMFNKQV
jgi:uncharacterized FlaG/YvyC family protein